VISAIAARAALAVLALAAAVLLVRRRARRDAPSSPVAVVARASLGPGAGVALVEAGGRRLLLGVGKDGVRLVRDLGPTEVRP
jgi:flagellar biogenesis protein FliO